MNEFEKKEFIFLLSNYLMINNDECLKAVRIYCARNNIDWDDILKNIHSYFEDMDSKYNKDDRINYDYELESFIKYY
jgi:hypothetical protein